MYLTTNWLLEIDRKYYGRNINVLNVQYLFRTLYNFVINICNSHHHNNINIEELHENSTDNICSNIGAAKNQ